MANAYTLTSDLIVPEVWAEMVQFEFTGKLIMNQFATVDTQLVGVPGDTVNYPEFTELTTDAVDLTENVAQETGKIGSTSTQVTVKEVGVGFSVTDQASLYALGNAVQEGRRQVPIKIARKVDTDLAASMVAAGPTDVGNIANPLDLDLISTAIADFGEDYTPQDMRALVVTSQIVHLMRTSQILQDSTAAAGRPVVLTGQVGSIYGVPVVQLDRGMADTLAILVGPDNPLQLTMKAFPEIELEREAAFRRTNVYSRVHYGVTRRYPGAVRFISSDGTLA